jgi:hypothetical protein
MISGLLGIAVSLAIGYFVCALIWPSDGSPNLAIFFAPAVGIGLCSLLFVVFRRPLFVIESALLLILAVAWFASGMPSAPKVSFVGKWRPPAAYLLVACALGMALSYAIVRVERSPHGDFDAIAIWNSHARYLYRDGPSWQKTILNTFHADYPLLVPATTARLWRYMGQEIPDSAGMLGLLYALAAVAVLISTLARLRTDSHGVILGLTLVGTPFYVDYATSGSADVPLSMFVLVTIALLCLHSQGAPKKQGLLVMAGFTAGCAGWTKNEGQLFMAATCIALLAPIFSKPALTVRRLYAFLAGMALPLFVIVWFKMTVAPPNDMTGNRHLEEVLQKVLSPPRYFTTWMGLSDGFWTFGNWLVNPIVLVLVYILLQRIDRKMLLNEGWLQGVSICVLLMAGYFAIYIATPEDLQWHIESSLPRLYLHVWPAFLLLAGLTGSKAPEQT